MDVYAATAAKPRPSELNNNVQPQPSVRSEFVDSMAAEVLEQKLKPGKSEVQ